jgi:tetratricopeptide (TPR) repeat protein
VSRPTKRKRPLPDRARPAAEKPELEPDSTRRLIPGEARRDAVFAGAGLLLAALVAFGGTLGNGFLNWDDDVYVYANPHLRELSMANVRWAFGSTFPHWHPAAWLLHLLEHALAGPRPAVYHAVSVLLHAANMALIGVLFLSLASWTGRAASRRLVPAGAWTAVLFGVHPLRVESVAWASEQKDLLCAFFVLLTTLAYLSYAQAPQGRRLGRYLLLLGLFALALLSKPMAVTLPAVMLLLDWFPLRRLTWRRAPHLLVEKAPLLAMSLLVGIITIIPPSDRPRRSPLMAPEGHARAILPFRSLEFYLEKTLVPYPLVPFYPLPPAEERTILAPRFLGPALAVLALSAAALWLWRRGRPALLAVWLTYAVMLLPVSGIVPLSGQEAADRFSYLPMVGFHLLLGFGLLRLLEWRGLAAQALPAALAVVLALLTFQQTRIWKDSETFWTYVMTRFPGRVVMAHNNLGALYHERGIKTRERSWLERAEHEYKTAIRIFPNHASAHNNLGLLYGQLGRDDESEREFLEALRIQPEHPDALGNLAGLYLVKGDRSKAIELARRALRQGAAVRPAVLQALGMDLRRVR